MKYAFIVNPNSGKKNGLEKAYEAEFFFRERGAEVDIFISEKQGECFTLAENLETDIYRGVIAVGGDGTLFEVINGLFRRNNSFSVPVGLIPVGTGNSFIRDLDFDYEKSPLEVILEGKTRNVDLGHFSCNKGNYHFINLLGAGFVSNVVKRSLRYKFLGSLSYILAVLEEFLFMKSTPLELEVDGKLYKRDIHFIEICNSRYTGGKMMMAPDAEIDDGLLDIIILKKSSRLKLLRIFPLIFKGTHVRYDELEVLRGKNISVKTGIPLLLTPDGESFGHTPIDVELKAGKIEMFA